jgi:predicted HD phosphohydrolase
MREQFRGHPHFEATAEFCAKYDQTAFDPNYDSAPLSFFEPMVMQLLSVPRTSIYKRALATE